MMLTDLHIRPCTRHTAYRHPQWLYKTSHMCDTGSVLQEVCVCPADRCSGQPFLRVQPHQPQCGAHSSTLPGQPWPPNTLGGCECAAATAA